MKIELAYRAKVRYTASNLIRDCFCAYVCTDLEKINRG